MLTNKGQPDKPDIRTCRLPDLKRKMQTRFATTQVRTAPAFESASRHTSNFSLVFFPNPCSSSFPIAQRAVITQQRYSVHPHVSTADAMILSRSSLPRQDQERNQVGERDLVTIVDGKYKGKTGAVVYIMRGVLFVKSSEMVCT